MRDDPAAVVDIAAKVFGGRAAEEGELASDEERSDMLQLRVVELMELLRADGINVSSLDGEQWDELLKTAGLTPSQVVDARESIASWAITDEG